MPISKWCLAFGAELCPHIIGDKCSADDYILAAKIIWC